MTMSNTVKVSALAVALPHEREMREMRERERESSSAATTRAQHVHVHVLDRRPRLDRDWTELHGGAFAIEEHVPLFVAALEAALEGSCSNGR